MKYISWIMVLLAIFLGFVVPTIAATTPVGGPMSGDNFSGLPGINLNDKTIFRILQGFACWGARIAGMLIVAALIIYAFQFFFSRGNPAGMQSAKRSFLLGIVGIIVILGAYTIIATVGHTITGDPMQYSDYLPISCGS